MTEVVSRTVPVGSGGAAREFWAWRLAFDSQMRVKNCHMRLPSMSNEAVGYYVDMLAPTLLIRLRAMLSAPAVSGTPLEAPA
jgi:hypothetical protein